MINSLKELMEQGFRYEKDCHLKRHIADMAWARKPHFGAVKADFTAKRPIRSEELGTERGDNHQFLS